MNKNTRTIFAVSLLLVFSSALHAQPVYEWAKGINGGEWSQNITRDSRGNIYLSGIFGGSSDFDPGPSNALITTGESNYYVAKYDLNGNYIFAFPIPVPNPEEIQIVVDQSSNIYLTGSLDAGQDHQNIDFDPGPGVAFISTSGEENTFVAKYDSSGNYLWAFAIDSLDCTGYWPRDFVKHIAVDKYGNVYLTGYFQGSIDFDPGPKEARMNADSSDVFLVKYDRDGNFVWVHKAGGKGNDGGVGIALDNSGNAYITGWTAGHAIFDSKSEGGFLADTTSNFFFAKYDPSGKFQWVKSIATTFFIGGAIALDSAGNIYTTLNFDSSVDVDPGPGVVHIPNYGYFIGKYSNDGQYIWARGIGQNANPYDLAVGISNNVYVSGILGRTNNFDQGNGSTNITAYSHNIDMFIAKYDINGKYQWAMHCGSPDTASFNYGCSALGMIVDASENIYATGIFQGTTDFDPGPGVANLTTFVSRYIFFAKYSQVKSSVQSQVREMSSISIYPNPSTDLIHLQGILPTPAKLTTKVFNILGSEVLHQTFDAPSEFSLQMDVSKLSAGMYTIELTSADFRKQVQFVKE